MAPLPFTKQNFDKLRADLAAIVKSNTALAKDMAKLKKERDELRALVDEAKNHLHDEVVKNVLGGSKTLEKVALDQIKKWVGKAIKALDKIF